MTCYEELSDDMRKQVDATVWLINEHACYGSLDANRKMYIQEHIANTVVTCLSIEAKKTKKGRKQ